MGHHSGVECGSATGDVSWGVDLLEGWAVRITCTVLYCSGGNINTAVIVFGWLYQKVSIHRVAFSGCWAWGVGM